LFCLGPTGVWVKADYLQWWEQGSHVPALAITGSATAALTSTGAPATDLAGNPLGTITAPQTLFGDDFINNKSESGLRIQAGAWLNRCATIGFEGEFFFLGDESTNYYLWSTGSGAQFGNPVIARPFNDVNPSSPGPTAELVAFPRGFVNSIDGAINISMTTRFDGAGAHFLFTTCRQEGCWTDDCGCCATTYHDRFRADFVAGYRYLNLEDQLGITETITSTNPTYLIPTSTGGTSNIGGASYFVHDQFNTHNSFNGADLGMKFEFQRNRWSLDLFPRIALGSTHSVVDINGSTQITNAVAFGSSPVPTSYQGGLLAQYGPGLNGGSHTQNNFAVVPELDLNLGFQFTNHTRLVVGYTGMYWSSVARAGEQIDTSVNSAGVPAYGGTSAATPARPSFAFQNTGFWAQGVNVGVDCRW
jgi:hypothetical protein